MLLYLGLAPTLGMGVMGCNNETRFNETVDDMGRAPIQRMNRQEFDYSVRHLLGVDASAIGLIPPDEESFDFLVMADALTVSPYHIESYELAIDQALTEFFGPFEATYTIQAEGDWTTRYGGFRNGPNWWVLGEELSSSIVLRFDGDYEVGVRGFAYDDVLPKVSLWLDDQYVGVMNFNAPSPDTANYRTFEIPLTAGGHTIRLEEEGGGLASIDAIDFHGPIDPPADRSPIYEQIVPCHPDDAGDACIDQVLTAFLDKAWRGPQAAEALAWARALYEAGAAGNDGRFEDGLRVAFKGILLAPDFLYREEASPAEGSTDFEPLSDYEVASRLSYFLWSSTPDDRLYEAAANGELVTAGGIVEQARRMLVDNRSEALVDTFAAQWFDFDRLADFTPDPAKYRNFDEDLRQSMIAEMRGLASRFVRGDLDIYQLLTTQEALLDATMAEHYLLAYTGGGQQLMSLEYTGRVGLLGTAGWQMAHSHQSEPSVVQRGKWVLGRMLCDAPPPPPPNINQDLELVDFLGSVREQEEHQRAVEPCVSCHREMDPIGFVLGDFDVIGHERTHDELGYRIDTDVQIQGTRVSDLEELAEWVANDARYPRCVVEQAFMFAMGRYVGEHDQGNIDAITDRFVDQGATFPALVDAITGHPAFRHRGALIEEALQ